MQVKWEIFFNYSHNKYNKGNNNSSKSEKLKKTGKQDLKPN